MQNKKITFLELLKFLVPSILGVLLLMTPFKINGKSTVLVSIISTVIREGITKLIGIHWLILLSIIISTILGLINIIFKPRYISEHPLLKDCSNVSIFWLVIRLLGCVFAIMTAFQVGPRFIIAESTGGLILFDLICGLFTIFLVAGFILPLLTDFGLLEYVGVFLSKIMRPVFNLPGRSAIDCIASWIGDGTIGVALTNRQYEEGYYNAREASVIATTFSAVSITFCLVVLENVNLIDYFPAFYAVVGISGLLAAFIIPRIPPLSLKKNSFYREERQSQGETVPEGYTKHQWALQLAVSKADENFNLLNYLKSGTKTVLSLWLGVIPTIMAVGTLALIVSENTPLFQWLGIPFKPLLLLLQVPEAQAASETMVVGFADMVVPSILAQNIPNKMTQFIVAATSVTQLLYMSETGAVILGTSLPLNVLDLFIIFIERTIITLPIITLFAHLLF